MLSFRKIGAEVVKKRTSNMKVLHIIPLNYRLTGHPQNFKIKLCYFQERLSLLYQHNPEVTVAVSYIFLAK